MATIDPPPPVAQRQGQQPTSTFPEELPQRPLQRPRGSSIRTCLSLNFFRSYNLRRTPNPRTKWRRIAMIATLFFAFSTAVVSLLFAWATVAELVVFCVLDFFFFWALCWSLAVNGDAVGSRKVMGIQWNRGILDTVIYASTILYLLFFVLWLLFIGRLFFQAFWLVLTAANVGVAWIASEPPYQT